MPRSIPDPRVCITRLVGQFARWGTGGTNKEGVIAKQENPLGVDVSARERVVAIRRLGKPFPIPTHRGGRSMRLQTNGSTSSTPLASKSCRFRVASGSP